MTTQITTKTMSSLEVSELTGKRHDHVLRDIRKMISTLEAAKEVSPNLGWLCETGSYVDSQGKAQVMYLMDKETTLTLLSGYDVVARHKIIQRWQQLETEKAQSETLPASQDELILMLAQRNVDTARRVAALEDRVERIVQIQQEAHDNLTALPAPTEPMAEMATEDKIRKMVNLYATATSTPPQDVWRLLYADLYYRYHVQVNNFALKKGESKLQAIKRHGHLDKLWLIAGYKLRIEQKA